MNLISFIFELLNIDAKCHNLLKLIDTLMFISLLTSNNNKDTTRASLPLPCNKCVFTFESFSLVFHV